eukprot:SAG31_NODE_6068_length_2185_cov_1.495686_3_plen_300_part_00
MQPLATAWVCPRRVHHQGEVSLSLSLSLSLSFSIPTAGHHGHDKSYRPYLNSARESVANELSCEGEDIVFVENASSGVNAVMRSMPWQPGDKVLYLNCAYGMVKSVLGFLKRYPNSSQSLPIHPNPSQSIPIHPNQSESLPIHPNSSQSIRITPNSSQSLPIHPNSSQLSQLIPIHPNSSQSIPIHPNSSQLGRNRSSWSKLQWKKLDSAQRRPSSRRSRRWWTNMVGRRRSGSQSSLTSHRSRQLCCQVGPPLPFISIFLSIFLYFFLYLFMYPFRYLFIYLFVASETVLRPVARGAR